MKPLQLEPARAKHVSDRKLAEIWDDLDWSMELKLNGWRELLHFGGGLDRPYLTGRRVSSVTGLMSEKGENVPCLWPELTLADSPLTVLDGEVLPPDGASFHDMAGILNSDLAVTEKRIAEIGQPVYHVFDILYHEGQDVRELCLLERRQLLGEVLAKQRHPLWRRVVPCEPREVTFRELVADGEEGVILKRGDSAYGESGAWIKCKREVTLDVIITGFTDARFGRTGKYEGLVGAVMVSVYSTTGDLLEVAQVSGMTDDLRREITANKETFLGTVCEITAQEFGQDRLLHPRWRRHKPEGDPRHCTFRKMQSDLEAVGTKKAVAKAPREQLKLF